jgi:hypothetical protein
MVVLALVVAAGLGCVRSSDQGNLESGPPLSPDDEALHQRLRADLSGIINEQTVRYTPLQYNYDEGLLEILDEIEPFLSGKVDGEPPRYLPELDAEEELDHLRETVRRWEAETGLDLRTEVDRFKARVAARDPDQVNDPEFHANFSETFDQLIAIEVDEIRERSNRAIHAEAAPLLDEHRGSSPEVVRRLEAILSSPQYQVPAAGTAEGDQAEPEDG